MSLAVRIMGLLLSAVAVQFAINAINALRPNAGGTAPQ
jgi:small neutral amino acid transporter SnatA (MarC family)